MNEKILIVEDDEKIARILELQLKYHEYETDKAENGKEALQKLKYGSFDLILLDVMLPVMNGFEVCRKIRESSDIPVILLTARDSVTDKVIGLDLGADDYVTKPFETEELLARIKARLRKSAAFVIKEKKLKIDDLEIDQTRFVVKRNGVTLELSKKEFELLEYMAINRGIVLTRDKIIERLWGYEGSDNNLDVLIKYLRDKIDKNFDKKLISTIRGIGYTIK